MQGVTLFLTVVVVDLMYNTCCVNLYFLLTIEREPQKFRIAFSINRVNHKRRN